MKFDGCEQRKVLYNAQCFGALGNFFLFFSSPFFFLPSPESSLVDPLLSLSFGKAAFWLHTKTRLRFVLGGFCRGCIIFRWVLLLIMP